MEWIDTLMHDTLMLDTAQSQPLRTPVDVMDYTRVTDLHGITLLTANASSRQEIAAALNLLREFRTAGRRVVLCDTSRLVVGKQFGHELVHGGGAELLISCGLGGREVGIGARDAGLQLSSVVVCSQTLAGGHVLANQLAPDDTVLLLNIDSFSYKNVVALLNQRFSRQAEVAA